MTNLNIAKLYLAANAGTTATALDAAIADTSANTAVQALSTAAFVEAAYQAAFGRAADAEGLAYWSNEIDVNGMAKDDAFMTALNYGATVYVAPTVDAPLVIGGVTFTAATVSATDDVAVAAAKATAEAAASSASAGSVAAAVVSVIDTATAAAAVVTIDAADAAADAADAATVYTLTVNTDNIASGTASDTYDASTANTFNTLDRIVDESTTDNDTLSIVDTVGTQTATVTNVENINVDWNSIAAATFDATNVTGATITLGSSKLGFSGAATVNNTISNNAAAGAGVTNFTVANIRTSAVDAGSATTVGLTLDAGAGAGIITAATLTVNSNINSLTNTVQALTLNATADSNVILTGAGQIVNSLDVTGAGDVSISGAVTGEIITNNLTSGTLTVTTTTAAAPVAVSLIEADLIKLSGAVGANALTVANGQALEVNAGTDIGAAVITGATANSTVALTINGDQTAVDVTNANLVGLNVSVAANSVVTMTTDATTLVTYTGASTLDLTTLTGAALVDASAMTGVLTYAGANTVQDITGSSAGNVVTFVNAANTAAFTGGAGVDTISALSLAGGTLATTLGAGNDTVTIDETIAAGTVAMNGGAGTDTLALNNTGGAVSVAAATLTLTDVEVITSDTAVTFDAAQLSGKAYSIDAQAGNVAANMIVTTALAAGTTSSTVDMSSLAFGTLTSDGSKFTTTNVTLTAGDDTLTATALDDTITGGVGADTITLGAGMDTLSIDDTSAHSTETSMDKISGFTAAAITLAAGGDVIDFGTTGTAVANLTDGDVAAVTVVAAIANAVGGEVATVTATNGFLSLSGTDATSIDTLAEWIDVAQLALAADNAVGAVTGFVFGGNTYLVGDGAAAAGTTSDDVIVELTGLTTATSINTTAGADVINIA